MRLEHRWLGLSVVLVVASTLGGCSCGKKSSNGPSDCDPRFVSASGECDAGAIDGMAILEGLDSHAGIRVTLDGQREAVTGDDGRFWFDSVTPGTRSLLLSLDGGFVAPMSVIVAAGKVSVVGPVTLGGSHAIVAGRVLLADALDHGGTIVTVVDGPEVALTRADGSFRFQGLSRGTHTLRAQHAGYQTAELQIDVTGTSMLLDPMRLDALPAGGTIAGRVTIAGTGDPAVDATVVVVDAGVSVRTDEVGFFEIENVPAGAWEVRAGLPGFGPAVAMDVVVASGVVTRIDLVVTPSGDTTSVVGWARRLGGSEHAGIEVSLSDGEASFSATTRADGMWKIEPIPVGLYELRAAADGLAPETMPGVAVAAGPNAAPDVEVGPAIRMASENTEWVAVLPKTRRAIYEPASGGLFRFDADEMSSTPLVDGWFDGYGHDRTEQYVTVGAYSGSYDLYRLTVADGTLEPVTPGDVYNYWMWPGLGFLMTEDGSLFILSPESLEAEPVDLICSAWYVYPDEWLGDLDQDWRALVRVRTYCNESYVALADLADGFVGFFGDEIVEGSTKGRGVSIRYGRDEVPVFAPAMDSHLPPWQLPSQAWWTDLDARVSLKLSDSISRVFGGSGAGVLAYAEELDGGLHPLHRVDLDTGATTLVSQDALEYYAAGPRTVMARGHDEGDPMRWYALDGPEQGILCDDEVDWALDESSGTIACFGGDRQLHVFDPLTRNVGTWDEEAGQIDYVGPRMVMWTSSDGGQHLRHLNGPASIDWATTPYTSISATALADLWLLEGADIGTVVVNPATGAMATITAPGAPTPVRCEVSPSMATAVCLEDCAFDICGVVHDLAGGTSVNLGPLPWSSEMAIAWAPDEASVAFGGGFFAIRSGDTWTGSGCMLPSTAYDVRVVSGGTVALWELWNGAGALCSASGTTTGTGMISPLSTATAVPGTQSYGLRDGVANLATGTITPYPESVQSYIELPPGLYATTVDGNFMSVDSDGGTILFSGYHYVVPLRSGWYLSTWDDEGQAIWSIDGAGIAPVAGGVDYFEEIDEDRVLLVGRNDLVTGRSLRFLTPSTGAIEELDVRVSPFGDVSWFTDSIVFESADDYAIRRVALGTGELSTLATSGSIVEVDGMDHVYFLADGLLWQSGDDGAHAVIRGDVAWLSGITGGVAVVGRESPDATYWYEVRE